MCLAVPGKILSVDEGPDATLGRVATIDFQGSRMEANLAMTPEAGAGDWVLVHAGFAITQLDEEEAKETWETLKTALGDHFELPGEVPSDGKEGE